MLDEFAKASKKGGTGSQQRTDTSYQNKETSKQNKGKQENYPTNALNCAPLTAFYCYLIGWKYLTDIYPESTITNGR